MTDSSKRHTGVTRHLTRLFHDNPGVTYTVRDLKRELKALGVTGLTDDSVRNSLSYMRQIFEQGTGVVNPQTVKRGQSWVHQPEKAIKTEGAKAETPRPAPKPNTGTRMWEEIGLAKDGETFILRNPEGKIFNAYEM